MLVYDKRNFDGLPGAKDIMPGELPVRCTKTKKPPVGGFTTLLIALIILFFPMVPGVGLEPTQRERRGILNHACYL